MENGLEPLKMGSPSMKLESGTCEHPQGRRAQPTFPLFVSKLFETRVTLKIQLFIKCGQVSTAPRSSILAQRCCGPSAGQENMRFPEVEQKACLFTGPIGRGGAGPGGPGQREDLGPWPQTPVPQCCFLRCDDCILPFLNCPCLRLNPQVWSGLNAWLI